MNPWEAYAPGDPRADPKNWDPFGLYIGPTDYQPDYHGGTISTSYQPGPSIFQLGSVYSGSGNVSPSPPAHAAAAAPATAPATYQTDASTSGGSYATPATAPVPATGPDVPSGPPAGVSVPAPEPVAGYGNALAGYGRDAGPSAGSNWGEPTWNPPATAPALGNRWDSPLFSRYFATLGASQPDRVALIRGLPGSIRSVPLQEVASWQRRRPMTSPGTMPTGYRQHSPPRVATENKRTLVPGGPDASWETPLTEPTQWDRR